MKFSITLILLFVFTLLVTAQKTGNYKYVYKFQLKKINDSCSFLIESSVAGKENTILKGSITHKAYKSTDFFSVYLKNKDTVILTTTNDSGLFKMKAKPGTYELTISGIGYQTWSRLINLNDIDSLPVKIILSTVAPMDWYTIHSTQKLSQIQISDIKKCVSNTPDNPFKCRRKNKYYVVMEI